MFQLTRSLSPTRDLQEKILKAPNKFTTQTKFELSNVYEEVIKNILLNLDTSNATGMDQIPATFLRDSAEVLAPPFRNIMNSSIKPSTFPEECKFFQS